MSVYEKTLTKRRSRIITGCIVKDYSEYEDSAMLGVWDEEILGGANAINPTRRDFRWRIGYT